MTLLSCCKLVQYNRFVFLWPVSDSDVEMLPPQSGDMPCPMPECMTACEFGYRNNERGCMTCECNTEPCEVRKD